MPLGRLKGRQSSRADPDVSIGRLLGKGPVLREFERTLMGKKEELIVGLDLGTTKVCSVVGEVTAEGIDIVGVGTYPSAGLRGGVVVNIDQTVNSI